MDLLNLGQQARRTGLRAPTNIRRDEHDMEDINDFFADDESDNNVSDNVSTSNSGRGKTTRTSERSGSTRKSDLNNVARKIDFTNTEADLFVLSPIALGGKSTRKNKKSPLRLPLPEHIEHNQDHDHDHDYDLDIDTSLSPANENEEYTEEYAIPVVKKGATLAKNMALGKTRPAPKKRRKGAPTLEESELDDEGTSPSTPQKLLSSFQGSKTARTPSLLKTSSRASSSVSKAAKHTTSAPKRRPAKSKTKASPVVTKPLPLPLPPPDGRRRSKRKRVPPLAFWRNEKIVYTRDDEFLEDQNSPMVPDLGNAPLQLIKEWVTVPEEREATTKRASHRKKATSTSKLNNKPSDYDYQLDPEVEGSEWYQKKQLSLDVYANASTDKKSRRTVAWAPNAGSFRTPENDDPSKIENFKVATLFKEDETFTASGVIELPAEGLKSFRNTGKVVFIFHVVKGLINVTINDSSFVVTRGCSFEVPRGNYYGLKNIGTGVAKLFFVQVSAPENAEMVSDGEWD